MKLNEEYLIGYYRADNGSNYIVWVDKALYNAGVSDSLLIYHNIGNKDIYYGTKTSFNEIKFKDLAYANQKKLENIHPYLFIDDDKIISGIKVGTEVKLNELPKTRNNGDSLYWPDYDYVVKLKEMHTLPASVGSEHPFSGYTFGNGLFACISKNALEDSWKGESTIICNFPTTSNPFYPVIIPKSKFEIVYIPTRGMQQHEATDMSTEELGKYKTPDGMFYFITEGLGKDELILVRSTETNYLDGGIIPAGSYCTVDAEDFLNNDDGRMAFICKITLDGEKDIDGYDDIKDYEAITNETYNDIKSDVFKHISGYNFKPILKTEAIRKFKKANKSQNAKLKSENMPQSNSNPYIFVKYPNGNAYYFTLKGDFNYQGMSGALVIHHALSKHPYTCKRGDVREVQWEDIPVSYQMDILSLNDVLKPYLLDKELELKKQNLEQTQTKTQTSKMETPKKKTGMLSGLMGGLNMEFGKLDRKDIAYSMMGLAVQKKDGNWVTYNQQANEIVEIGDFQMDVEFYQIPTQALAKGDYTIIDGTVYLVNEVKADGSLSCICPTTGSKATKVKRNNLFGMYFYTKIVSMFDLMGGLNGGNQQGGMNPMMLMMMMGNKDGESSGMGGMMEMMMMSQMMGGQQSGQTSNPFANMFGYAPPVAPKTEDALGGLSIDDAREMAEFKKWKAEQAKN